MLQDERNKDSFGGEDSPIDDILQELDAIRGVKKNASEDVFTITVECGSFFTIVCC